jgi:hypothetical protein
MLWTIFVVVLLLYLIGILVFNTSGWIDLLLVVAGVILAFNILTSRRMSR